MLHKVAPKETWTSVSKKYSVTIADVQKANPGVDVLKINQIINVPAYKNTAVTPAKTETPVAISSTPVAQTSSKTTSSAKYHTVAKGETLYRISKQYGITVSELQSMNKLSSSNVPVGMKLKVGEGKTTASQENNIPVEVIDPNKPENQHPKNEPAKAVIKTEPVKTEPIKTETVKSEPVKSNNTSVPVTTEPVSSTHSTSEATGTTPAKTETAGQKITESGIATWIADSEMNQNKFYALHKTAPVGTIIKVTNRMNNNSVYVKVIGVLPATGDNENILIKITQAAAQRIGALDQRFQAELSYAAQ